MSGLFALIFHINPLTAGKYALLEGKNIFYYCIPIEIRKKIFDLIG